MLCTVIVSHTASRVYVEPLPFFPCIKLSPRDVRVIHLYVSRLGSFMLVC